MDLWFSWRKGGEQLDVTKKDEVLRTVDMSDARASIGPL